MKRILLHPPLFLLTILLFVLAGCTLPAPTDGLAVAGSPPDAVLAPVATEEFTVDLGDFQTPARLTYPANATGGSPTVILIHGGPPFDMDSTLIMEEGKPPQSAIFKDIADYLTPRGIAVLRYNKHYVTSATEVDYEKDAQLDLPGLVQDAERVLAAAKANPHVDPQRIFVYGWSEGSMVASMLVTQHPEVAGLILQGAAVQPLRERIAFQDLEVVLPYLLSLSPDGQITPAVLKQAHEGDAGFPVKWIPSNFTSPDSTPAGDIAVNPVLDTNKDGALDPETEIKPGYAALLDTILAPDGEVATFEARRGRPLVIELAPQLTLPVLILQGESDAITSVQGARKLAAALAANPDHTLKIYPGLDHALGPAATPADEKYLPIAQAPLADIVAWVLAQSAKAQTFAQPPFQNALAYGVPAMDEVVVRTVEYSRFGNTPLTMDIYYPPDMDSNAHLPVVIFVFGFPDPVAEQLGGTKLKDFGQYLSWGRLTAAAGLIAVTYETQQPDADLEAVIAFIQQHGASLHMDADRLGLWACSANVPTALSFVMQASREEVKLAVVYYGQMVTPDQKYREQIDAFGQELGFYAAELKDVEQLRPDLPLFMVRAGLDEVPWVKESMDHFVSAALSSNVPLTLINYAEGVHGFDTDLANAQSPEIIKQTLAFMQRHLAEE